MFKKTTSAILQGLRVEFVQIEVDINQGLPMFQMVGYLSSEVKEAGERVRTAIRNSGFLLPAKKIIVNLSPANIRKRGTVFDLGIAVAILGALEERSEDDARNVLFAGELSLDGSVKGVKGILPIVHAAQKEGFKSCIVSKENEKEGALVNGIQVIGVSNLREAYEYITGKRSYRKKTCVTPSFQKEFCEADFAEIRGQALAKRAVEIAVAGGHNILMVGPPGSGKTAIAKRIPSILPPLTLEESMEVTMIYSIVGEVDEEYPLKTARPFREVHSTITKMGLLGGGIYPKPGEISLAHKGVMFLDEIAEFPRSTMESLRKPLEDREVKIIREKGEFCFPAESLLVAAMNPCPCGNFPDLNKCTCTPTQRQAYLGKLSQPFLERIDICVEVPKVQYDELAMERKEESSNVIRERIVRAREIQKERYQNLENQINAGLDIKQIETFCALNQKERDLMKHAYNRLGLSARTYHKVLLVARTIADLEGSASIKEKHLREALGYRTMEFREGR